MLIVFVVKMLRWCRLGRDRTLGNAFSTFVLGWELRCRMSYVRCHLGSVVRFVVVLKPKGPWFNPGLANYVYRTMLDIAC